MYSKYIIQYDRVHPLEMVIRRIDFDFTDILKYGT